tara:strand:+ start:20388 stop:21767 length:1380 start_codon:yes stop_codon:yes gene_type:complete
VKKTLILAAIAGALGAFVFFYEIEGGKKREEAEHYQSSLIKMDKDDIQAVTLIQEGGEIIRYQRSGESWEITEPVRTGVEESAVNGNHSAFANAIIQRTLDTMPDKLKNFSLEPARVEVILESKEGKKVELLIGDEAPTRGDLFVSFRDSNSVFITSSDLKTQAEKTLFDLRDKKIAHYEKDDVRRIELVSRNHIIVIEKTGDEWEMKTPDLPVEESRVNSFLTSLTNYSAKAFTVESFSDESEYGFDKPEVKVNLSLGEEMASKEITIGRVVDEESDDAEYHGYESGLPAVFIIRESTKNNISRDPFYFQDKQLARFDKEALNEIRISGAYQITLAPQDTLGWYVNADTSFKIDDSDLNRFISAIDGVNAAELVADTPDDKGNYGLKIPFLEVVVKDSLGVSTGFSIGDPDDDNDRYASTNRSDRIYLVRLSQVERITDWIEEILGTYDDQSGEISGA